MTVRATGRNFVGLCSAQILGRDPATGLSFRRPRKYERFASVRMMSSQLVLSWRVLPCSVNICNKLEIDILSPCKRPFLMQIMARFWGLLKSSLWTPP